MILWYSISVTFQFSSSSGNSADRKAETDGCCNEVSQPFSTPYLLSFVYSSAVTAKLEVRSTRWQLMTRTKGSPENVTWTHTHTRTQHSYLLNQHRVFSTDVDGTIISKTLRSPFFIVVIISFSCKTKIGIFRNFLEGTSFWGIFSRRASSSSVSCLIRQKIDYYQSEI